MKNENLDLDDIVNVVNSLEENIKLLGKSFPHEEANRVLKALINILEDNGYVRTIDTNEFLIEGEGAYYIEGEGEWYRNWIKMIAACFKSGMTKEEIFEGLDLDFNGNLYYTSYYPS